MASKRQVLEIPGLAHNAPIPMAVKYGNMIFSSAIMGKDPETGRLGDGPDEQAKFCFENLRRVLEIGGATPDNVTHITVYLTDHEYRQAVNKPWLEMFPDEHDRPARHAVKADLPQGYLLQIEIIAVI